MFDEGDCTTDPDDRAPARQAPRQDHRLDPPDRAEEPRRQVTDRPGVREDRGRGEAGGRDLMSSHEHRLWNIPGCAALTGATGGCVVEEPFARQRRPIPGSCPYRPEASRPSCRRKESAPQSTGRRSERARPRPTSRRAAPEPALRAGTPGSADKRTARESAALRFDHDTPGSEPIAARRSMAVRATSPGRFRNQARSPPVQRNRFRKSRRVFGPFVRKCGSASGR